MYGSLQAVESEMCPSFIEAIKAGEPVKIVSDPTTLADALNVPMVSLAYLYLVLKNHRFKTWILSAICRLVQLLLKLYVNTQAILRH